MNAASEEGLFIPPHSIDAERAVLGGVLRHNDALPRIAGILHEADFYAKSNRIIWKAIKGRVVNDAAAPFDVLTIAECMRGDGTLTEAGGIEYLHQLMAASAGAANVKFFAGVVAAHARRREAAAFALTLHERAMAPGADVAAWHAEAADRLAELRLRTDEGASYSLDLEALAAREPSPPGALMAGLPTGYATLLAGHGGIGKSLIVLYLCICMALGRDFFGLPVQRRMVRFLSCEDREAVLHWRLSLICAHLGVDMADLRGWLEIEDLVGHDAIMWRDDPRGSSTTEAYRALAERMRVGKTEVLVADGVNDIFAGNENDRGHVKAFVNAMLALISQDRGALVLIGHVAKAVASGFSSEGYSGSTAWHNAVRARWYLHPETEPGEEGNRPKPTGALLLELQKANHGDEVALRFQWDADAHIFIGQVIGGESRFDRQVQDRSEKQAILASFRSCADAIPPLAVPAAMTGPRTALHVLTARPEFPAALRAGRPAARRFWRHVEELRQMRAIEESSIRRTNRHLTACLAITDEGRRECAE
ncbi:MAG: AAA family ATPase [Alphaproteobacteria bacterium]|nr:AAA family ATPase [Alphaproteobacteria bacterium]